MIKTIKGKIILGIVFVTMAVQIITNIIIWSFLASNLEKYIINDMDKVKSIAYREMEQYVFEDSEASPDLRSKLLPILNSIHNRYNTYISVDENENENITYTGRVLDENYRRIILAESRMKSSILYTVSGKGGFFASYTYPIYIKDDYKGTLVLQKNYIDEYKSYKKIMTEIIVLEIIFYIIMISIIYIWLNAATSPLRKLRDGMKKVGEGDYSSTIDIRGNDEIADLTRRFNNMQDKIMRQIDQLYIDKKRIEELEKNTKEFFNYATHEMKIPITALKGYGELLEQGGIEPDTQKKIFKRIVLESDRIHSLVRNMLTVARGKEKAAEKCESFNLKPMLLEIAAEFELTAEKEKTDIELYIDDLYISAVKEDIGTIFRNLIDNAIKYSSDKKIHIQTASDKIQITNKCRPIPEKIREHLLEPFIKYNYGDVEKVSSGLGLFICKDLAAKNNGSISYSINDDIICFSIEFTSEVDSNV